MAVFGHFGSTNFGNESTLQALLYHLRRFDPQAKVTCICTDPEAAAAIHKVDAVPISSTLLDVRAPRSRLLKVVRRICVGFPNEMYRWVKAGAGLREADVFVVPGTGLLTDMAGLRGFGPYSLFQWSLVARLRRCRVFFVSVGAGPIDSSVGRRLTRGALSLASYRSYRDESSRSYLESLGIPVGCDPVYPDLVFSPPERPAIDEPRKNGGSVVGLGVMVLPEQLTSPRPRAEVYEGYVENLAGVAEWLLDRGYDIKLLIGDVNDLRAGEDLRRLVRKRRPSGVDERLVSEPVESVDDIVSQIASTDVVIASRFHNVLDAVLRGKPVVAISSHPKSEALMRSLGLADYCLDVDTFTADQVIERVRRLETDADAIGAPARRKAAEFREALDRQYERIFAEMRSSTGP